MRSAELRREFLNFFHSKRHQVVKSASLVPHNDNTLLFTNAGMVPFKNCFLGLTEPLAPALSSAQKCLRAGGKHNDLDNVGYTARHHTFFEMLGNFSFGKYFKEEAITYAFEFITKVLALPLTKLLVTVYHTDEESYRIWRSLGFSEERIIRISSSDNFWSMGNSGPCGPCTEIFYDFGESVEGGPPGSAEEDGDRFTEIWNLVFMQYNQHEDGTREELAVPCVDTGMGLERLAAVMGGVLDNYDTDVFAALMSQTSELLKLDMNARNRPSFKIIADHIRAAAFLIADGVLPLNEGRGYVLRRIMRRAIRHAYLLGNKAPVLHQLVPTVVKLMHEPYEELLRTQGLISSTIAQEEERFNSTIGGGMKLLKSELGKVKNGVLSGEVAFKLYDTYGFPLDLTQDILKKDGILVDTSAFDAAMEAQRSLSKSNWVGSGEAQLGEFWLELHQRGLHNKFVGYKRVLHESKLKALVSGDFKPQSKISALEAGADLKDLKVAAAQEDCPGAEQGSKLSDFAVFKETPCYAESGGQVGDQGVILGLKDAWTSQLTPQTYYLAELLAKWGGSKHKEQAQAFLAKLDAKPQVCTSEMALSPAGFTQESRVDCFSAAQDIIHPFGAHLAHGVSGRNLQALVECPAVEALAVITDTQEEVQGLIYHKIRLLKGELCAERTYAVVVDTPTRWAATLNHTATHLMFAVMQQMFGENISQQGSLVTPERLRADVSLNKPLTLEEIKEVEHRVNSIIFANLPITVEHLQYEEALARGAKFLLGKNYPAEVRVVSVLDGINSLAMPISVELCGGCHAGATGDIRLFKIISEASIRSGVRRLEAVTGAAALAYLEGKEDTLRTAIATLKANESTFLTKLETLLQEHKLLLNRVNALEEKQFAAQVKAASLAGSGGTIGAKIVSLAVKAADFSKVRRWLPKTLKNLDHELLLIYTQEQDRVSFMVAQAPKGTNSLNLSNLMQEVSSSLQVTGGGNSSLVQGSVSKENWPAFMNKLTQFAR